MQQNKHYTSIYKHLPLLHLAPKRWWQCYKKNDPNNDNLNSYSYRPIFLPYNNMGTYAYCQE